MPGCAAVSLPLMPVFGWAMTKIGPKRLYAINFIGWLGTAWLFAAWMLVGALPEPWWTVFAVIGSLWFFAFKSLCGYLPWAVFPCIVDIDQIVTRRYRSATFSDIQASFRQLGSGIATIAAGLVLGAVGFDATRARHRIDRDHPPVQRRRQGRRRARNPSCGGTPDRSALRELLAVAGEARLMNGRAAMPCRSLHW